jgi:Tol biopolymer transport system component
MFSAALNRIVAMLALGVTLGVCASAAGTPSKRNGLIAFSAFRGHPALRSDIYLLDSQKRVRNLTRSKTSEQAPAWSSDGRKIAFVVEPVLGNGGDIFVMNADGRHRRKLTSHHVAETVGLSWSPDSTRIAFVTGGKLSVIGVRGGAPTAINIRSDVDVLGCAWSPTGSQIAIGALWRSTPGVLYGIGVVPVRGGPAKRLTRSAGELEQNPNWSPDATKIAFDDEQNVYVVSAHGGRMRKVTRGGASDPEWSPDGKQIAFRLRLGSWNRDLRRDGRRRHTEATGRKAGRIGLAQLAATPIIGGDDKVGFKASVTRRKARSTRVPERGLVEA